MAPNKSIAVLPFDNLSRDPDNAYFCEGVQDEILTRLAKVADLKVISRTSTQHFKSAPDNLPQIAKQLGVAHILEGSVQKAADQVRVNVQLINAMTDAHLWADTYDRKLTDIFAVESEIAKAVAESLQAKLTGSEKVQLAKRRPLIRKHTSFISEENFSPRSGRAQTYANPASITIRRSQRILTTRSLMSAWRIPTCYFLTMPPSLPWIQFHRRDQR
jgi:TolB-like protein